MNNRQQNGRRRGRGGGNGGGGGPRPNGGGGRADSGNRIDNRARGNAAQLLEKYRNLAADAQRQGDRVNTEYYLQFADHYFRVLADQRGRFEDQQPVRRAQNDFDLDGEDEYGDEGEPIRAGEQAGAGDADDRQYQPAQQQQPRRERNWNGERANGGERGDRGFNADRSDRGPRPPRGEARAERDAQPELIAGQHRADPPVAGESLDLRAEQVIEADAPLAPPAPRRRGRPRREEIAVEATEAPAGVDADRLPPSLGIAAANDPDDAPKPRRRRPRAAATETPDAAE